MSRIRANQITNQSADGAPTVQNGLIISGVTTSSLVGINTNPQRLLTISKSSTASYNSSGESAADNSILRIHNPSGYDDSGVNNHTGLEFLVSSGANSIGQIGLVRTGNNIGDMFFKFRTAASSYAERFRIGSTGAIGLSGANYGTSGQVLTSGGSGSAATWSTINSDAINEGNTKAEVIDSGSDGRFIVETEGTQRIRIDSNGLGITSTTTSARNAGVGTAIGTIIFNSTVNQLQVYANNLQWRGFSPLDATLTNISGTIYYGQASTLTLTGTNFLTANLQVNFIQATRSIDVTVAVTPSSNTAASVSNVS